MAGYDAGSVETRLKADFDRTDFDKYAAAVAAADAATVKKAKLAGDFDKREFEAFERAKRAIEADEIVVKLRGESKQLKSDLAQAEQALEGFERKRARAREGERVAAAAQLRESRKRRDALKADIAAQNDLLAAARRHQQSLRATAKLYGDSTREVKENVKATRTLTQEGGRNYRQMNLVGRALGGVADGGRRAAAGIGKMIPGLSYSTRIPVYKILAIGGAFAAIVPPAIALAGALGPLVGLLGALPALATAGFGALTAGLLGMRGIGKAVTEAWQSTTQTAGEATKASKQARDSTEAVAKAQEDLNEAYEEATRQLEDMRMAQRRARLEQEDSTDALADAQQELARLISSGADQEEISDQRRAVAQAELGVADARLESKRASEDLSEAERGGLRQMDQVVAATRALRDANEAAADQTEALSSNQKQLENSLNNLSPAGRRFVELIRDDFFPLFERLRNTAQEGLLPGLGRGLVEARQNFPVLERMVAGYADALGDAGAAQGRFFGARQTGRDLGNVFGQGEALTRKFGSALVYVERGLLDIAVAAKPLVGWLGDMTVELSKQFAQWTQTNRESGKLEDFFRRTIVVTKQVTTALAEFGRGLINIGRIAARVWGGDMLAGITDVAKAFRRWTESVKGERDIEQFFVRWRERWHDIADAVGDVVERYQELRREGDKPLDAFARTLGESISKAAPVFFEQAGKLGLIFVREFVESFIAANVWGKLFLGTWFLRKFGGAGHIGRFGARIANLVVGGMNEKLGGILGKLGSVRGATPVNPVFVEDATGGGGVPGGRPGKPGAPGLPGIPPVAGKLLPIYGAAGLAVGLVSVGFMATSMKLTPNDVAFIRRRTGGGEDRPTPSDPTGRPDVGAGITPGFVGDPRFQGRRPTRAAPEDIPAFGSRQAYQAAEQLRKKLRDVNREIFQLRTDGSANLKELSENAGKNLEHIRHVLGLNTREGKEAALRNFDAAVDGIARKMTSGETNVRKGMAAIERLMKSHSKAGRVGLAQEMEETANSIRNTMKRAGRVTKEGLDTVKQLMVKELEMYGLSPRAALASANVRSGEVAGGFRRQDQQRGGILNVIRAMGGALVPGVGDGDTVPVHVGGRLAAMVEPGELVSVLNRKATEAMMAINRDVPRFRGGGMVRAPGDPDDTGGRDLVSPSVARRIGQWVRKYNANVGYAYDPGGGHKSPGHNVTGTATDVYPGAGGSWDLLEQGLKVLVAAGLTVYYGTNGVGIPLADHGRGNHAHIEWGGAGAIPGLRAPRIKQVLVRGRDSPLRDVAQRAVDITRHGAQRRLNRVVNRMFADGRGGPGGPGTDNIRGQGSELMKRISRQRGWNFADWWEVDRRESGHGTNLLNESSGAALRGQFMPGLTQGQYGPGSAPWLNPTMSQQIWSMARYIKDRYGNPTAARAFHDSHNWYQRGGVLRLQGGGVLGGHTGLKARQGGYKAVDRLETDLTKLGNRYTLTERRQGLSEEELINEGDEDTPPSLNQEAITQRLSELDVLIKIRREMTMKYAKLVRYVRGLINAYRAMQSKALREMGAAAKGLAALKGRKGKEARRSRTRLEGDQADAKGRLDTARTSLEELKPSLIDALYNEESSRIDLATLRQEAGPLRGGGAGLELPDWEAAGPTADEQALTEQATRRAETAEASAKSLRTALQVFAGPGDLGRAGSTAKDALLNPTGVPGPGYAVGPNGELVPVVGAGAAGVAGTPQTAMGGNTYVFPSTVPYTREQAASVAGMAVSGIEGQAPRTSARVEVPF